MKPYGNINILMKNIELKIENMKYLLPDCPDLLLFATNEGSVVDDARPKRNIKYIDETI